MAAKNQPDRLVELANIICLLSLLVIVTLVLAVFLCAPDAMSCPAWWWWILGAAAALTWSRIVIARPLGRVATASEYLLYAIGLAACVVLYLRGFDFKSLWPLFVELP